MMRSRQNGGFYELLCSVCDQPYAGLYPDRLFIFSNHFGKSHTTAFLLEHVEGIYEVAESGRVARIDCSCGQKPCGIIQLQAFVIETKHKSRGWHKHANALTLSNLAEICGYISASSDILRVESDAPDVTALERAS